MRVTKIELTPAEKWLRLLRAVASPSAWLHMVKLLNFYNYSHVVPLREMQVGEDCHISPTAKFAHARRIKLGSRILVGENCRLWAGPATGCIAIGDDTMLGPNTLVTAASYDYRAGTPTRLQPMLEEDVKIGRDVWIGAGAVVLMGSHVGDGSVVGANSVVRGVIPAGSVVCGAPARIVASRQQ